MKIRINIKKNPADARETGCVKEEFHEAVQDRTSSETSDRIAALQLLREGDSIERVFFGGEALGI